MLVTNDMIFEFNAESNISKWVILDDIVMGGKSDGNFTLNKKGNGVFSGVISLDNNGGFSSVRYRLDKKCLKKYSKFIIKIKGDGKAYQFRAKKNQYDSHSYIYTFQTTSDWQTIEIPFSEMYPAFRGRILNMKNYQGKQLQEIAFLIGNKKNESFKLEIDEIEVSQ
tara:strand:+ start:2535 stop:3035 length:501 start_codon:yes stop_codon:yes gene_type:complete